ncbi:MAG TPA: tRNA uridine-5-carboxymethylaminomethyl(34) synthesis GTPase MnmE [Candidatus Binataceae bacterium]|nr:tRNA uridine-5-carboxymethylaminomethyl(34) synthesis GTPase MnmE [Candidatus Binataceae bacterium]
MYEADTIVAPATAPGMGAVAIVRLSGPQAMAIGRCLWQPLRPKRCDSGRLYLGEIRDPKTGAPIDRALAVFMPGPATLTGEDICELHCHGGPFIVRRIVSLALAQGARMAQPGEFSRRAFLNGRLDLTAAEAVADLVAAHSDAALAQALAQLNGALRQRIEGLRSQLISIRAHLEAEIDFSDEELALPSRPALAQAIEALRADVAELHDSFDRGRLLRDGARAAIIGRPNSGKSSVLNLLLGVERAIVTAIAGTTRDLIEDSLSLDPYALVIIDTAGLRHGADEVERIGIERARTQARDADLLIAVFDASQPLGVEDEEVIDLCRGRRGIALLNKADLPPAINTDTLAAHGLTIPAMSISALRGEGAGELRTRLRDAVAALQDGGGAPGQIAISRQRHRQALAHALDALAVARDNLRAGLPPEIVVVDLTQASDALGTICGEVGSEDVLDAIFREFCIGK